MLMGDIWGSNEIAGVVGKWGAVVVNENGEHLMDVCAERGLFLANTFQHRLIGRGRKTGGDDTEHLTS